MFTTLVTSLFKEALLEIFQVELIFSIRVVLIREKTLIKTALSED